MTEKTEEESVLGSLPATRSTRFGGERRKSANGKSATATKAKPKPKAARGREAEAEARTGAASRARPAPGPRRRTLARRVDGARPHRRARV